MKKILHTFNIMNMPVNVEIEIDKEKDELKAHIRSLVISHSQKFKLSETINSLSELIDQLKSA